MVEIIDDIGKIVQSLRNGGVYEPFDLGDENGTPNFLYGRKKVISNRLSSLDDRPTWHLKKYPLIALNGDFYGVPRAGGIMDYNLNILIANETHINWDEEEKQSKNFLPVLEPLLKNFTDAFLNYGNGFFWSGDQDILPCQNIWRRSFKSGVDDGKYNIFNDPIDAIEIVGLKFSKQSLNNC